MKYITIIGILCILFSSCLSSKKYSSFVDKKVNRLNGKNILLKDWLIIKALETEPIGFYYYQSKNPFFYAIRTNDWDNKITCRLNISTRLKFFEMGIINAANRLNLRHYLEGSLLEISLKEIPGEFTYESKGGVSIFLIGHTIGASESITPNTINLDYEFSVVSNGRKKIEGKGVILNNGQIIKNKRKSTKKFTLDYLERYQEETEQMGIALVKEIIEEIKIRKR